VVETGRVDKFRLTNAGEGDAIAQVYGRMRMGGRSSGLPTLSRR